MWYDFPVIFKNNVQTLVIKVDEHTVINTTRYTVARLLRSDRHDDVIGGGICVCIRDTIDTVGDALVTVNYN